MPKVVIVPTGGTIDSIGRDRLDLAFYPENGQRLPLADLLKELPEVKGFADVELVDFPRRSSHALAPLDWIRLAETVTTLTAREDVDGVVVTHGTNTLEETAFFLHLTCDSRKPIVTVGALRPISGLGTDAGLNLVRAVQAAASTGVDRLGVLVLSNDTIFSARDVTKTSTFRVDAFKAPDAGPLGCADADGRVVVFHELRSPQRVVDLFDVRGRSTLPRVDVVVSYVGADGVMVEAAVAAGAKGIVAAGTGAGRVTPNEEAALLRAAESGVVVCLASRVGSGRVARSPAMERNRFIVAGNLQPWKARVLLSLALTRTTEPEEIQRLFDST